MSSQKGSVARERVAVEQQAERCTVQMLSLTPHGGFHHYTAALCNALARHPRVKAVHYLSIFREQRAFGVGREEHELVDPAVWMDYLAPGGRLTRLRKYGFFLRNLVRYMRRTWQGAYDVIHVQTGTYNQVFNLALLVWFKAAGVPVIRTIHEIHLAERGRGMGLFRRWLAHLELGLANHLVVHDTIMQERLGRALGRDKRTLTVIPQGNYLEFRKYLPKGYDDLRIYLGGRIPVVLFFGVKRHKGLEIFLQAWRMVQAEGHSLKALLAGTVHAEDAGFGEEARRLPGIEVDARYIPNSRLWEYFCRSTLVVMPYLAGTTSAAVHLAYAFKRPVIVSDLDCFQGMVIPNQTGLVVPRGDAIALKEAIVQLGKDRERCRQMGEEGFRLVSSAAYHWDTIAEQTVQVYEKVKNCPVQRKQGHPSGAR